GGIAARARDERPRRDFPGRRTGTARRVRRNRRNEPREPSDAARPLSDRRSRRALAEPVPVRPSTTRARRAARPRGRSRDEDRRDSDTRLDPRRRSAALSLGFSARLRSESAVRAARPAALESPARVPSPPGLGGARATGRRLAARRARSGLPDRDRDRRADSARAFRQVPLLQGTRRPLPPAGVGRPAYAPLSVSPRDGVPESPGRQAFGTDRVQQPPWGPRENLHDAARQRDRQRLDRRDPAEPHEQHE